MRKHSRLGKFAAIGLSLAAVALLTTVGTSGATSRSTHAVKHLKGGTATWALPPNANVNYIWPFYSGQYCSVQNIGNFMQLMYRPLYWFGGNNNPGPTASLSLAANPKMSGKTAVINLKHYKWSNGETVTANDVLFFLNIYHAEPSQFCGFVPGLMPQNVASVKVLSQSSISVTFKKAYTTAWVQSNELSQITPFPMAWDVTKPGGKHLGCATGAYGTKATDSKCKAVWGYFSGEAANEAHWTTNSLWQIVDGPWRLSAYDTGTGQATLVPNKSYSGPIKPSLSKFVELPFTKDTIEFAALKANALDVGALPAVDVTSNASNPLKAGANNPALAAHYNIAPLYPWGIDYFPYNFKAGARGPEGPGTAGQRTAAAIMKQLYFRQAFQSLVDQSLFISHFWHGYAVPTYGPVPVLPPNKYATATEKSNPYPFSPSKAQKLLSTHGWKVVPGGTSVCEVAAKCGPGIAKGTKLSLTMLYATGNVAFENQEVAQDSAWKLAGINVALQPKDFNTIVGTAFDPNNHNWELANWSGGWTFAPDYLPTGEDLFASGSISNPGYYSNAHADALIKASLTSQKYSTFASFENFLAKNLPVSWQPEPAYSITEVAKNLHGVTPQNLKLSINPENWYFS